VSKVGLLHAPRQVGCLPHGSKDRFEFDHEEYSNIQESSCSLAGRMGRILARKTRS
jgi:hypothetical protein